MSGWLSLAIAVVLVVVAFLILNRTITRRTSQQAALDEIKREVGLIITELNATTERNIELIEDRIARLEGLIGQADKRLVALKRDSAAREAARPRSGSGEMKGGEEPIVYTRLGRPAPSRADPSSTARPSEPAARQGASPDTAAEPAAPQGASPEREAPGASPPTGGRRAAAGDVPGESELPLRERVQMLYLRGLPMQRIASIVGKTVGEVELIVSLGESGKG